MSKQVFAKDGVMVIVYRQSGHIGCTPYQYRLAPTFYNGTRIFLDRKSNQFMNGHFQMKSGITGTILVEGVQH